ncbi:conserved Plasmodium protein, unknown function [Plasmodium knowlesi strain H]|uniref:Uncharacterized protein n=3 Tax=Plasmodium knowlesi TaxID=5850 RepID=A0A1A7W4Y3_PLAKH|nr:conserved Plasmodium protein, unknown function [Plasmodium knowlesi strain H]OTN63982.1 Uncharacterized protein PKNOH_S140284300 [Plasmodium knowlesi]CAA9991253.1 conserved Plasmodium protein, unknown function [Plasmodium knowlesi strain H]SBO26332.1 conserved Plasmodium protein, unknown function [Plasmodium knowlesi strain H]SBO29040.1 conserved Plasmodium protein, unknown function [Plasmodium knowlesi strain H]VVS80727.1 conserved Plasmodium protein, unknown function [Plasmodium knowlesi 
MFHVKAQMWGRLSSRRVLSAWAVLFLLGGELVGSPKSFAEGILRILPAKDSIDGILVHLPYKFIKHRVYSRGIYLHGNFDNLDSVINLVEMQKKITNLHCNLRKEKGEFIRGGTTHGGTSKGNDTDGKTDHGQTDHRQTDHRETDQRETDDGETYDRGDVLITNNCVLFVDIKYKDNLKNIFPFMDYLYKHTSATALVFLCDNFLYDNELYNPHEDLNTTILHSSVLTYLVPYDSMISYQQKDQYHKYTFELYWGFSKKTDIVHINYHLDLGKYFNYTFFHYMKNFLLDLKEHITYEIHFSIHKNFTIDPRFCFIRDSSYCISKPDYMNSNVVREVVEQQVRSLCVYHLTATEEHVPGEYVATYAPKKRFSEKFIQYINALFDFEFEKNLCSNGSNDLSKKCSNIILDHLGVPVQEINKCFLKNFHTYMKDMIKSKFYVYSIQINGQTYKLKLNKDISIRLICSAFRVMPKRCADYFAGGVYGTSLVRKKSKKKELVAFYILLLLVLSHILGTLLNYLVSCHLDMIEKN